MSRPRNKTRMLAIGTALTGLVAVAIVGAPAASAYTYDNTDPIATGCADDAQTVYTRNISSNGGVIGKIELRYSPSCRTAWARGTNYLNHIQGVQYQMDVLIIRNDGTTLPTCYMPNGTNQSCYTKQLNDVDPRQSRAKGVIDLSNGSASAITPFY